MGKLVIKGPQNINLDFEVNDLQVVKKFVESIGVLTESPIHEEPDIVGIWKESFNEYKGSNEIQNELRTELWKR